MIDTQKIFLVFGLPGAGKTTTINELLEKYPEFIRLSGGSLINCEITEAERDSLRKLDSDEILKNQELIAINFKKMAKKNQDKAIIFDGHCMIKHGDQFVEVPEHIIKSLSPSKIIFFNPSVEQIVERRKKDANRPDREVDSLEKILKIRDHQIEICKNYSVHLNVPFEIINDPTTKKLCDSICR